MARRRRSAVSERDLTKGQLRKLTTLRKSLGEEIGTRAFSEWLATAGSGPAQPADSHARTIAATLQPLIETGELRIRRGGYRLRRGRGRIIVEQLD